MLIITAFCTSATASPYTDFDFEDITFWVGEGENQAAFVVQWSDGDDTTCLAWGYRWDGDARAEDMIVALAGSGSTDGGRYPGDLDGADNRLYVSLHWWSDYNAYTLSGLGYDLDNDGFATDDPDDLYMSGWTSGYWSYWLSDDGSEWDYSGVGLSGRVLSDGSWDGWNFSGGGYGSGEGPGTPVAAQAPVPVLATVWLLGSGLLGLVGIRRRAKS
ncbi:hypothetical protein [Desulfosarcina ovata]|uniref:hypothetical protein n=1 Tax=Desulfosarcina ovata TaxID=83564 RepID=UPI0012D2D677|nr:hypothetical protein [Desulfosarcina ovata]